MRANPRVIFCLSLLLTSLSVASPPELEELRRAQRELERDPSNIDALRLVLDMSHAGGGLQKLVDGYQAKVAKRPQDGGLKLVLAHMQRHSGECGSAITTYREAAKLLPRAAAPWAGVADCHRLDERWNDAIDAYEEAVKRTRSKTRQAVILERLVGVALRAERDDVVKSAFERLVAVAPRDPLIRIGHAKALARSGRLTLAVSVWRDVHKLSANDHKARVLATRELGQLLGRLGRNKEAIAVFKTEIARLPAEHWAQFELQEGLIGVYRQQGKLNEYIRELEKRKQQYPVLLLLARLYEETGADDKALVTYREAVKRRPANVDARSALLRILSRIGSREQLVKEYQRLIKQVPGEPRYELELAELHFSAGQKDKGLALLDRMSRRYNQDPGIHESIADLLMRNEGDRERIEREFTALIRLEPDEESHLIQLGEYYFGEDERGKAVSTWMRLLKAVQDKAKANLLLARLFAEHEMQEEAITHFREAIRRKPKALKYYRAFAVYLEKVNRYKDAETAWNKILGLLDPGEHRKIREARQRIIRIASRDGSLGYKMDAFRRAFTAEPPDTTAGLMLAEGLIHEREFEEAGKVLEQIVAQRPKDVQALLALEEVYEKLNRLADSIGVLQKLAEIDPSAAREKLQKIADLSLDLHNTADALKYARLVVNLRPTDPDAHAHLGDVLVQVRRFDSALVAYRKSLQLNANQFAVRFKLVRVLERLERGEELIEALTAIVRTATEPADVLEAGRRILASPEMHVLQQFEPVLLEAAFQRAHKPVYRKLLVDLYAALVKRLSLVDHNREPSEKVADALRGIGQRGLKPILDSLADSDLAVRTRVLRILVSSRNVHAVLPLVRLLEEPDRVLRFQALVALAHIGAASSAVPVGKLLGVRHGHVGVGAIWALGALEGKKAGKLLKGLVNQPLPAGNAKVWVSLALGARGTADGLDAALDMFRKGGKHVREPAAWALGAIGDVRAVEPLLRRLPLESEGVQRVIVWSLGAIGSAKALAPLLRIAWGRDSELTPIARWAVARILSQKPYDKKQLREVYLGLHDFERAKLDPHRAFPALLHAGDDAALDVARLMKAHGGLAKRVLLEQLAASEPSVQVQVLSTLVTGEGRLVLGPLAPEAPFPEAWRAELRAATSKLAKSRNVDVRLAAIDVLTSLKSVDDLGQALSDAAASVRRAAASGLSSSEPARAVPLLLEGLSRGQLGTEWSGRAAAAITLGKLLPQASLHHPQAAEALASLLRDEFPMVRREALVAVKTMGKGGASLVLPIVDLLTDSRADVVIAAVEALSVMGSPMAVKPLTELQKNRNPHIKRAARAALDALR